MLIPSSFDDSTPRSKTFIKPLWMDELEYLLLPASHDPYPVPFCHCKLSIGFDKAEESAFMTHFLARVWRFRVEIFQNNVL